MAKLNLNEKLESFKTAVLSKKWNPRYSMQLVTFCLKVRNGNDSPVIVWEKRADPLILDKVIPNDIVESIDGSIKSIKNSSDWKLSAVLYEPGYNKCVMVDDDDEAPFVY